MDRTTAPGAELPAKAPPRRVFMVQAIGVAALLPVRGVEGAGRTTDAAAPGAGSGGAAASASVPSTDAGYTLLGPEEALFVEALVNVMCPADALTPSGTDCGLAVYIDRQLAGDFGKGGRLYSQGPWIQGKPQQGYQLPMKPAEFFKAGVVAARNAVQARHGTPFERLSPVDADAFLSDLAGGKVNDARLSLADWFSQLVYPLFQQAALPTRSTAAIETRSSGR